MAGQTAPSITPEQAMNLFNIVNSYYNAPLTFTPCSSDDECRSYRLAGDWRPPETYAGAPMSDAPAWYVGHKIYLNTQCTSLPYDAGGADFIAFILAHEINHYTTFPPDSFGYHLCMVLNMFVLESDLGRLPNLIADFIVNDGIISDRKLAAHLKVYNIDLYNGVLLTYDLQQHGRTTSDAEVTVGGRRPGIFRYNDVAVMRETDPARFAAVRGPNYQMIKDMIDEYHNLPIVEWEGRVSADTFIEWSRRSLVRLMNAWPSWWSF